MAVGGVVSFQRMPVDAYPDLSPPMVELTRRIHEGALGKVGCGLAYYYCAHIDRPEWPNASPEEKRLRNWVWDRALSGDIILEHRLGRLHGVLG